MPQVINETPGIGQLLGTGLGQGLGSGLQFLAQQKMQGLVNKQAARGLEALGFNPQEAHSISYLDPNVQKEIVKQRLLAPSQEAFAQSISELLGNPLQESAQETGLQILQQPSQLPKFNAADYLNPNPGLATAQRAGLNQQINVPVQQTAEVKPKPRLTEKQALELAKLGLQKQQIAEREKTSRFKETKADRKEIIDKYNTARQSLHDLDRMEELEKTGKLNTPGYVEFLHRSGLDIPALTNPESEEFRKIANNFTREAKSYFGGRVSNFEVEQFLKTIPSLSQSPEGRKRVIANLKYINNGAVEHYRALKEVLAENKGIPPLDLAEQVEDKVDKKSAYLAKKFKEDLAKPVPKGQNQFITALQAGAGSLIGLPGQIVGSFSKNALPIILGAG